MAAIKIASVSLLLFFVIVRSTHADWLKKYGENENAVKLLETTTEPLNNVLQYEQVQHSVADLSNHFESSTKFYPSGMDDLYILTEKFRIFTEKNQAFSEGFINVIDENKNTTYVEDVWLDESFTLLSTIVLLFFLFSIILLIILIVEFELYEEIRRCIKPVFTQMMAVMVLLLVFSSILLCFRMISNGSEEKTTNLPKKLRPELTNTELYIYNTRRIQNALLIANSEELEKTLLDSVDDSGKIVLDKLTPGNLIAYIEGLHMIRSDLLKVYGLTESLHEKSSKLDFSLKQIGAKIANDINACRVSQPLCSDFYQRFKVDGLSLQSNFSRLPDITIGLRSLFESASPDKVTLKKFKNYMQECVNSAVRSNVKNIKKTGGAIQIGNESIIVILDEINSVIVRKLHESDVKKKISAIPLSSYTYTSFVFRSHLSMIHGFSLIMILICMILFTTYKVCSSQKYFKYLPNKKALGRYLCLQVFSALFVFTAIILTINLWYFVAGINNSVIFPSLNDPHDNRTFLLFEKLANVDQYYTNERAPETAEPVTLKGIMRSCHGKLSLFEMLRMENPIITSQQNDIELIYDICEKITSIDLTLLASGLDDTANKLPSNYTNIKYSLHDSAIYLRTHQNEIKEIISMVEDLKITSIQLREHLKFNHSSLKTAIKDLMPEVEEIGKSAKDISHIFTLYMEEFLTTTISSTQHSSGRCWSVSLFDDFIVLAGCNTFLSNFNDYWQDLSYTVKLVIFALINVILLLCLPIIARSLLIKEKLSSVTDNGEENNIPLTCVRDGKDKNHRMRDVCSSNDSQKANHNLSNVGSSHSASKVDKATSRHHVSAISHSSSPTNVVNSIPLNTAASISSNHKGLYDKLSSKLYALANREHCGNVDDKMKKNHRPSNVCSGSNPLNANHNSNNAGISQNIASIVDIAKSGHQDSAVLPSGLPDNAVESVPLLATAPVASNQSSKSFDEIVSINPTQIEEYERPAPYYYPCLKPGTLSNW